MKKMVYGVDLGWASQLESMGYRWLNENGEETDILAASKELGVNAVRLRVFVNPPESAYWQKRAEWRAAFGMAAVPGGNKLLLRKDTGVITEEGGESDENN